MLNKCKSFFRKPVNLLAVLISCAVLCVGGVVAFRALAAPDGYEGYNVKHIYYRGSADKLSVVYYGSDAESRRESDLILVDGANTLSGTTMVKNNNEMLCDAEGFPAGGAGVDYSISGHVDLIAKVSYRENIYSYEYTLDKYDVAPYASANLTPGYPYYTDENGNDLKENMRADYDFEGEEAIYRQEFLEQHPFDDYYDAAYQNVCSNYYWSNYYAVYNGIKLAHGHEGDNSWDWIWDDGWNYDRAAQEADAQLQAEIAEREAEFAAEATQQATDSRNNDANEYAEKNVSNAFDAMYENAAAAQRYYYSDTQQEVENGITNMDLLLGHGYNVYFSAEWVIGQRFNVDYPMTKSPYGNFSFTSGEVEVLKSDNSETKIEIYNGDTKLDIVNQYQIDQNCFTTDYEGGDDVTQNIIWIDGGSVETFSFVGTTAAYANSSSPFDATLPLSVKLLYGYGQNKVKESADDWGCEDKQNLFAQNNDFSQNNAFGVYSLIASNEGNKPPFNLLRQAYTFADSDNAPVFVPEGTEEEAAATGWLIVDTEEPVLALGSEKTAGQIYNMGKLSEFVFDSTTGYYQATFTVEPMYNYVQYKIKKLKADKSFDGYVDFTDSQYEDLYRDYRLATKSENETVQLQSAFILPGYRFEDEDEDPRWTLSSPGSQKEGWVGGATQKMQPGDSFVMPEMPVLVEGSLTPIPFKVKYNKNNNDAQELKDGGVVVSDEKTFYLYDTSNIIENGLLTGYSYSFPAYTTSADGYTFMGWGLSADSTKPATGINMSVEDASEENKVYNVYGIWEEETYKVTYQATDENGNAIDLTADEYGETYKESKYAKDAEVTVAQALTKDGCTFSGWSSDKVSIQDGKFTMPAENIVLTGSFELNKHNVTYTVSGDVPDGYSTDSINQTDVAYGMEVTVAAQPEIANYLFTGWNTDVTINDGKFTMPDEDVALTGIFTKQSFTVSYSVSGTVPDGWTAPESHQEKWGTTVTPKAVPAYDTSRYLFEGWKKDGTVVDTFTMPAENVELTGVFSENDRITLRYDANRGNGADIINSLTQSDYNKVTATIATMPDGITRTGYTFAGKWITAPNGGAEYTVGQTNQEFDVDTTLYAVWNEESYALDYQNGGVDAATIPADETDLLYSTVKDGYALSATTPTAPGYSFKSWLVDGIEYQPGDTIPFSAFDNNNKTAVVVAQWNDWMYHVVYEKGDGHDTATNMPTNEDYLYGDVHLAPYPTISTQQPADDGYTFTGWSVAKKGGTQVFTVADLSDSGVSKAVTDADFPDDTKTIVVTALWEAIPDPTYTVTYRVTSSDPTSDAYTLPVDANAYHEGDTVTAAAGLSVDGYTFDGWYKGTEKVTSFNMPAENVELTGSFTKNPDPTYTVTYRVTSSDPASGAYTLPVDSNAYHAGDTVTVAAKLNVDGYTFDGWYKGTEKVTSFQMPAENVELTGSFTKDSDQTTYTLIYSDNKDAYNVVIDDFYNEMKEITGIPAHVTLTASQLAQGYTLAASGPDSYNYEFIGWGLTPDRTTDELITSVGSDDFNGADTLTVYAKWRAKMIITYSSGLVDEQTQQTEFVVDVYDVNGYIIKANSELNPPFTRQGFEIKTWQVTEGNSLVEIIEAAPSGGSAEPARKTSHPDVDWLNPGDKVRFHGNITMTAKWTPVAPVTLTYKANGGSPKSAVPNEENPIEYQPGDTVTVESGDALKNGEQVFKYWSTTANDETGSQHYKTGNTFTISEDTVLYAIYGDAPDSGNDGEYTVTYDKNGGTGTEPVDSNKYKGGDTVTVADKGDLTKDGCTFKEWNTKSNGTGTGYKGDGTDSFTMPESNVTLYAIWVNSNGDIVLPSTGETNIPFIIAANALLISLIAGAYVVMRQMKAHRKDA